MERWVRVDHVAEPLDWHPGVDGQREHAEHLAIGGANLCGAQSATSLVKPWLPALWIQPRAVDGTWVAPTSTSTPASRAASSETLTDSTSGWVNVTLGSAA